jgi:hypothetical protein
LKKIVFLFLKNYLKKMINLEKENSVEVQSSYKGVRIYAIENSNLGFHYKKYFKKEDFPLVEMEKLQ